MITMVLPQVKISTQPSKSDYNFEITTKCQFTHPVIIQLLRINEVIFYVK
jgi:hypothetical protein